VTACPAERCAGDSDPDRTDGYCSRECARTNALITPPQGYPLRSIRGGIVPGTPGPKATAPFDPTRECGCCHARVLRVHGPTPGLVRIVDADPHRGGRLVLRGDQVIAELRGTRLAGWGDAAFAVHDCPIVRELGR
jgi:hypothetical protein